MYTDREMKTFAEHLGQRTHPKSAPLMYTERDMVIEQRKAFVQGWTDYQSVEAFGDVHDAMRRRYPLPKITRPRVVLDEDGYAWRIRPSTGATTKEDDIEWCCASSLSQRQHADSGDWSPLLRNGATCLSHTFTAQRLALWLGLLEHPNEEVEDDDG